MTKQAALRGKNSGANVRKARGRKVSREKQPEAPLASESEEQSSDASRQHDSENLAGLSAAAKAAGPAALGGDAFKAMLLDAGAQAEAGAGSAEGSSNTPTPAAPKSGGGFSPVLALAGLGAVGGIVAAAAGGSKKNSAPAFSAADLAVSIDEDKSLSGSVRASDPDGDVLTYAVGTAPANGTVTVNSDGSYVYTPKANYNGADSFTVTASDGKGGSATQTVKVTVNPVNDAPVFAAAEITPAAFNEDTNLVGSVRATDVDGDTLTYAVGTRPANGTVTVNADGSYVYTPNPNYNGVDSFTVVASDGKGGTASQTVKLTIVPVNDAPVVSGAVTGAATEDGAVVTLNGLANASDVDAGTTLAVTDVGTLPAGVTRSGNSFTLDPSNAAYQSLAAGQTTTVTVNYSVSDGITSTPATAVFTVTGTNDLPVVSATADRAVVFQEAEPTATVPSSKFIKVAGSDIDGGVVTFSVPTQTARANITLAADGSGFTYTPLDINYHGTETVTVRLNDAQGSGNYTDYTVEITVTPNVAENQDIDNGLTLAILDAAGSGYTAGDNFTFIDDSTKTTNVEILNFQQGDRIQVSASASKYSFAVTAEGDLQITYLDSASGASNVIVLKGVAVNAGFIEDEATAEAQLGLGNFFVSLADGGASAGGGFVGGTSLDVDSDSNVNTFALFDAAGADVAFTDDANLASRALIQGFGVGDTITIANALLSAYSFARDENSGNDIVITYNNNGTINEIVLQGAATGATGVLDSLAAAEALLGIGFFKSASNSGGGGGSIFEPTATTIIDNASGTALFNAGTGSIKFTDDAGIRSDVVLQNFGPDDRIYTNTPLSNYSFAISEDDADDLVITFNNNGVPNQIVLDEILFGKDVFIDSYSSAKDAVGFEFMVFG